MREDTKKTRRNINSLIMEDGMQKDKLTSIVILSFNQVEFTKNCLESIRKYTTTPYEVIIIDNNSNEETIHFLEEQKDIILIKNTENKGFAGGCNQGMEIAKGDYILLLNNDTIVTHNYLTNMIRTLEDTEETGIVGPVTNNTIGRQKLDIELDYENKNLIEQFGYEQSVSNKLPILTPRLIGFCMLFKREFINEIGMFDLSFHIGNYEDDDLCIRTLLAGKKMYICQNSFVYHYKRVSFDRNNLPFEDISLKNKKILENKWGGINWNHFAMTNSYIEKRVREIHPKSLLHIGCGVGALEIQMSNEMDCFTVGIEDHETRREIASRYLNKVYSYNMSSLFSHLKGITFEVIVIEGGIETYGTELLQKIMYYLKKDGIILIRVFNSRHITSIEKIITGEVWGDTICAVSPEFKYYYDESNLTEIFNRLNLLVQNKLEIHKTLKTRQLELLEKLKDYSQYKKEALIYNWIYELRKNE